VGKIIWLASYPKSGNTWMRVLLTNYLNDGDAPADINRLRGGPIASARVWFDEWVGVEASALEDALIEQLRPDCYRCMSLEIPDTLFMKVHDSWGRNDREEPLFPADVTAGVIYILRNPLDVAASCAHHWGVDVTQAVENLCNPAFSSSRSIDGLDDQLRQKLNSWGGHVRSWLDESGLPLHPVRYEDLQRDPVEVFSGVVRFCGLPWNEERLHKAIEFSDFRELQRQEQAGGFRERSVNASGLFFRRGLVGSWRDELPTDQVRRLIETHGETMLRFGYLDESGQPLGAI
jgi:aryl sulfotransferase